MGPSKDVDLESGKTKRSLEEDQEAGEAKKSKGEDKKGKEEDKKSKGEDNKTKGDDEKSASSSFTVSQIVNLSSCRHCVQVDSSGWTRVFISGQCLFLGKTGQRAGLGVWWGQGHPSNSSKRATAEK